MEYQNTALETTASLFICEQLGANDLGGFNRRQQSTTFVEIKKFVSHIMQDINPSKEAILCALRILKRTRKLIPQSFADIRPEDAISFGKVYFASSLVIAFNTMYGLTPFQSSQQSTNHIDLSTNSLWKDTTNKVWESAQRFGEDSFLDQLDPLRQVECILEILKGDTVLSRSEMIAGEGRPHH